VLAYCCCPRERVGGVVNVGVVPTADIGGSCLPLRETFAIDGAAATPPPVVDCLAIELSATV